MECSEPCQSSKMECFAKNSSRLPTYQYKKQGINSEEKFPKSIGKPDGLWKNFK